MSRPKRYALAIELTAFCNQKCGYCYNDWRHDPGELGSLPREELLGLVDRALTEVEFDHVTLTGGEPFARPEIFEVLEIVKKHGKRALIISNGGVITDAHAERLATYDPIYVQVTLNGPEAGLHEEHVGKDCFEPTLRGIRSLKQHGVHVAGCVVITRKNARVVGQILELWRSLGAVDIALSRFSPAGYASEQAAELLPSRSELLEALKQANPFGDPSNGAAAMRLQVTMPVPVCVVDHADYPNIHFGGCPIGTEMQEFALGPKGELRNCTLHTEVVGEPKQTSFAELVQSDKVMHYRDVTPEFCAPCPYKSSCLGGCGAAAASIFGEKGLDPFVAQHVDEGFAEKLRVARKGAGAFIPAGRLARRGTTTAGV